jgi:hypothetical protein
MAVETLLLCGMFGLWSNTISELLLSIDLKQPLGYLDPTHRRRRIVRWVVCVVGFLLVGLFHPSVPRLLLLEMFSVSASTDFETSFLPPDWFVYGSTLAGLAVGFFDGGVAGLRDAVVAQAVCFAMMVFAVLLANAADSGDIKLLMQYGAACGSLSAVGIGIAVEFVARVGILVVVFFWLYLRCRNTRLAFSTSAKTRMPHGPIAWIGLAGMLMITATCV